VPAGGQVRERNARRFAVVELVVHEGNSTAGQGKE
jgi:hypothetical protein